MGRKPKHNYEDPFFLLEIEGLARDGSTDKEIAKYLRVSAAQFCTIKKKYAKLVESIARARRPLNVVAENSMYKRVTGMTIKTVTRRYLEKKCKCGGKDPECEECRGTGKYKDISTEVVQETTQEIPPDPFSIREWLKAKKPEIWNKEPIKIHQTGEMTQNVNLIFDEVERKDDTGKKANGSLPASELGAV